MRCEASTDIVAAFDTGKRGMTGYFAKLSASSVL
jgi:hypothetical protein